MLKDLFNIFFSFFLKKKNVNGTDSDQRYALGFGINEENPEETFSTLNCKKRSTEKYKIHK